MIQRVKRGFGVKQQRCKTSKREQRGGVKTRAEVRTLAEELVHADADDGYANAEVQCQLVPEECCR